MPRPSVKEEIVQAAVKMLHERGFNATGVQDITDAAGVPKGSFYNHFKSKEALALEVLDQYRAGNHFDLLSEDGPAPIARLQAHFEFLAERLEGWKFTRGCLLGNFAAETADTNPALRDALPIAFHR